MIFTLCQEEIDNNSVIAGTYNDPRGYQTLGCLDIFLVDQRSNNRGVCGVLRFK